MPNFKIKTIGPGDQSWVGSAHGLKVARTEWLDTADFAGKVKGSVIPSGTPLALKDGQLKPYNPSGGDETAKLIGFLLTDQAKDAGKIGVPVMDSGRVIADRLPESFTAPDPAKDLTTIVYTKLEG